MWVTFGLVASSSYVYIDVYACTPQPFSVPVSVQLSYFFIMPLLRLTGAGAADSRTSAANYVKRFPKASGAGASAIDKLELKVQHENCIYVVEAMVLDPSLGSTLKSYIDQRKQKEASRAEENSGRFHHTYCYFEKISKDWMTQWLSLASDGGHNLVSMELLNKVDMQNIMDIRRLFYLVCGISGLRSSLASALTKRSVRVPCFVVVKSWAAGLTRSPLVSARTASLIWGRLGVYKIVFNTETGKGASIEHISGTTQTIPDHVMIDRSFQLVANDSESSAEVAKGVARFRLQEFFPKESPVWRHQLDKKASHLIAIARTVEAEVLRIKEAHNREVVTVAKGLEDATRERRAKIAAVARA